MIKHIRSHRGIPDGVMQRESNLQRDPSSVPSLLTST